MAKQEISQEEHRAMMRRKLIGKAIEVLDLERRLPAVMLRRGWNPGDEDLKACLALALACKRLRAGKTRILRPQGADVFGEKWLPIAIMTAERLVEELELEELLEAP